MISRIEGKAKMSQNQPERNRDGVIEGLRDSDSMLDRMVADQVATRRVRRRPG